MADNCQMWRRMRVGYGFLGDPESTYVYRYETRRCGTPLFNARDHELGLCRSCQAGWIDPHNMPVHPPLVIPEES